VRVYLKNIGFVTHAHDSAVASTAYCILRPRDRIEPRYLFWFVNWQKFTSWAIPLQRGNSPPAVVDSDVKGLPFPVPPLPEQRRIVARIDELFAEIAEGEAALERARSALDAWRRALFKAAVTGELTREWREANKSNETGVELLNRIRDTLQSSGARSDVVHAAVDTNIFHDGSLRDLPSDWVWARQCELGTVTGGLTKNPDRDKYPDKLPYLRVANVQMGRLDLTQMKKIGILPAERNRLLLASQDLLIVEGNGSIGQIGRCALWNDEVSPCVHQNHIIKVRFTDRSIAKWALTWLLSPTGRGEIKNVASSTSGLHTLSISKIENLIIPLAPIQEVTLALARLTDHLDAGSDAKKQIEALFTDKAALRQSILKSAFEGRLVPQDRSDEPASALLARLRAESAATPLPRRARGRKSAS